MDPYADTLRRLREAFSTGRTRPAEFRAAQLKGLRRFLQENKQLLQEALAQDLHKVGGGVGGYWLCPRCFPVYFTFSQQTMCDSVKSSKPVNHGSHVTEGETEVHGG